MKRFKDLKITTKLSILFLAVAVMLTLGAGCFVIRISTQNLISQIKEKYIRAASDSMKAIDIVMDKNYHQIQSFAQNEVFASGTGTAEDISAFLKKKKEIYKYACLSYYDMERIKIVDTDDEDLGKQEDAVGFWKDVLNDKVSAGSDVRMCEGSKALEINFAAPVKNKEGKAIGVVVAKYSVEDINQIIEDIKDESTHVVLIDRDKNVLFTNCELVKELILKEKIAELPSVKLALAGGDGVVLEYSPYHKKEYFTAYVQEKGWHDFKGNGWLLLISLEKDKALAPILPLRNSIVVVLILAVGVILIIGPLIARSITKPIEELNKVAQKIKEGDLTQRAKITAYDEVGELAMVFNQMVENLKEKYDELTRNQTAMLYMIEDLNRQAKELRDTQDKLVRSEKLAVIGQLASSVAHEIRNPLGVMKNTVYYFNMLELGKENTEIKENLDILSKEIENADKIISDLLEFSRVKKPTLRPEDINVIVNEVLHRLKIPSGIEVVTKLDDTLPEIEVDALQMQQVFYNISTNAIQAMEKGGSLKISTILQKTENRGQIEIAFQDTGGGIPKENLIKIFEPLFSTKTKGTGLGLSVVASLVEGHNGKIEVESEVGKGSIFTVKLPVKRG